MNNTPSNVARSVVHGRSSGTNDVGDSRSNFDTNELDILSEISFTMIRVGGMYVNKKALQRHLCRYTMSNLF